MTDIEKIIAEHAENMPHGEFTHDSECAEHEEWFKKDVREIVNLAIQEYESLPKVRGWVARDSVEDAFNRCSLILHYKKPWRTGGEWSNQTIAMHLPWNMFPDLKWEDEPIEVELTIKSL